MRILITGVNGLLGYDLANLLCADPNNTIFGFARSAALISAKNYTHIMDDLNTDNFVEHLPKHIDGIIHLAQSEKFRDFPDSAFEIFNINTISTLRLLDYAKKVKASKFIYASSGGVYGNKDIGFTEDSPIMGNGDLGFYLSSKLCSEILADNYSDFFNVIQLRFFFMYGERQNKTMLIPRLVNSVISGTPISLSGTEGIKINPIYVSDAAKAVVATLSLNHSDKINIGGDEDLSIKNIADMISKKVGIQPVYTFNQSESKNLIGDIKKMKTILHTPELNFEKGIENLINSK